MTALEEYNALRMRNTPENCTEWHSGFRACQRRADAMRDELLAEVERLRWMLEEAARDVSATEHQWRPVESEVKDELADLARRWEEAHHDPD